MLGKIRNLLLLLFYLLYLLLFYINACSFIFRSGNHIPALVSLDSKNAQTEYFKSVYVLLITREALLKIVLKNYTYDQGKTVLNKRKQVGRNCETAEKLGTNIKENGIVIHMYLMLNCRPGLNFL